MADLLCDCIDHLKTGDGGQLDQPCSRPVTHRLENEDGVAFLCKKHAAAVRVAVEPGQLRKLPAVEPFTRQAEEPKR